MKQQLLKSFGQKSVTKQAELLEMFANPSMGDNIPSAVLLMICYLSNSSYKDVECAIFLLHLPPVVWTAPASWKAATNDQPSDSANSIYLEHRVGARSRLPAVTAVRRVREEEEEEEVEWVPDAPSIHAAERPIPWMKENIV